MAHTVGQIRLAYLWSLGARRPRPYRRLGPTFLGLVLGGMGGLGGGEMAMAASNLGIQEGLSAQDVLLDGDHLPVDHVLLAEEAQSTPDEFPPLELDPSILEEKDALRFLSKYNKQITQRSVGQTASYFPQDFCGIG